MANSDGRPRYFSALLQTCEAHGEYTSMLIRDRWTPCVECDMARERDQEAARQVAWRQQLQQRAWAAKLGRGAIPERFADKRLSTYVPTCESAARALAIATRYAAKFPEMARNGTCLIFCGERGTGKTHMAAGIAHEVIAAGRVALFMSVVAAVRSVRETYAKDSQKTEAQAIRELIEPDLLILDEVGVQFGSDAEKLTLFEIINGRYEAVKPTIVLSNLAKPLVEKALGERSFDRLREGGGRMIVCDWESYRGRRPEEAA